MQQRVQLLIVSGGGDHEFNTCANKHSSSGRAPLVGLRSGSNASNTDFFGPGDRISGL